MMNKKILFLAVLVVSLFVFSSAYALDFDFSGNFVYDNDVAMFNFTVGEPSTVTIFSSSWLNGEPPYGFDPMLGIWTSAGSLMSFQDDGGNVGSTLSNGIPYSHGTWDSYYSVFLAPGDYKASVTQFANFNNGSNLSDGFSQDGNPNFTFDLGYGGATQPYFNGVWDSNDPRTDHFAFHILNVAEATYNPVPELSVFVLFGTGLLGIGILRKKH